MRLVRLAVGLAGLLVLAPSAAFGMVFTPLGLPAVPAAAAVAWAIPSLRRLVLGSRGAQRAWTATTGCLLLATPLFVGVFIVPSTSDQVWLALVPLGMLALAGVGFLIASIPAPGTVRDSLATGSTVIALLVGVPIIVGLAVASASAGAYDSNGYELRARVQVIFILVTLTAALIVFAWRHVQSR